MGTSKSRVKNFPQGGVKSKLGGVELKGGSAPLVKIIVVVVFAVVAVVFVFG